MGILLALPSLAMASAERGSMSGCGIHRLWRSPVDMSAIDGIVLQKSPEGMPGARIESQARTRRIEVAKIHSAVNQCCALQSAKYFCNTIDGRPARRPWKATDQRRYCQNTRRKRRRPVVSADTSVK